MSEQGRHRVPKLCKWFGHKPGIETWPIMVCWCLRCGTRCTKYGKPLPSTDSLSSLIRAATDNAWVDGHNAAIVNGIRARNSAGEPIA